MGRGGVEDTLETPEPGGAQAAPSLFPSAPSLLGTKFGAAPPREPGRGRGGQGGPASRERHPGRGSHLGAERFSRQRRARGGVFPVPRPTEAVHTSAPGPERGGPRRLRSPPPQRSATAGAPPARSAPHRAALPGGRSQRGDAPRGRRLSGCALPSHPPAGRARGSPGGSGGGGSRGM